MANKPSVAHAPHTCIMVIDNAGKVSPWPKSPGTNNPVPIGGIDDIHCNDLHAGDVYAILSVQIANAPPTNFTVELKGNVEQSRCHPVSDDQDGLYGCEWYTVLKQSNNQKLVVKVPGQPDKTVAIGAVAPTCHGQEACWKAIAADYARLEARIISDPPRPNMCVGACSAILEKFGDDSCRQSCTETLNRWLRLGDGLPMGSRPGSIDMSSTGLNQSSMVPSLEAMLAVSAIIMVAAIVKHVRARWRSR